MPSQVCDKDTLLKIGKFLQYEPNSEDWLNCLDELVRGWTQSYNQYKASISTSLLRLDLVNAFRNFSHLRKVKNELYFFSGLLPPDYFRLGPKKFRQSVTASRELEESAFQASPELLIEAYDPPNPLGINSVFEISGFSTHSHPVVKAAGLEPTTKIVLAFQDGNTKHGYNGISDEALFDVLEVRIANRMQCSLDLGIQELQQAKNRMSEARMWFDRSKSKEKTLNIEQG